MILPALPATSRNRPMCCCPGIPQSRRTREPATRLVRELETGQSVRFALCRLGTGGRRRDDLLPARSGAMPDQGPVFLQSVAARWAAVASSGLVLAFRIVYQAASGGLRPAAGDCDPAASGMGATRPYAFLGRGQTSRQKGASCHIRRRAKISPSFNSG